MLKISLLFKNLQTTRANNSRILTIKNAKFSCYCFYMKTYIQEDFQICISVPLCFHVVRIFENLDLKLLGYLFIYFFEVLDI